MLPGKSLLQLPTLTAATLLTLLALRYSQLIDAVASLRLRCRPSLAVAALELHTIIEYSQSIYITIPEDLGYNPNLRRQPFHNTLAIDPLLSWPSTSWLPRSIAPRYIHAGISPAYINLSIL